MSVRERKSCVEAKGECPLMACAGRHGVYNSVCGGWVGHEQAEERQQEGPLLLLCLPGGRGTLS